MNLSSTMSRNLKTISFDENLDLAYMLMKNQKIRHLVCINEVGEVCGLLSDRDLQRAMKSEIFHQGNFRTEDCEFDPSHQVRDYMSWPVKTIDEETNLKDVAMMMINEKVSAYLITKNREVSGIVTSEDLLKVLIKLLEQDKENLMVEIENFLMNPAIGRVAQTVSDVGI